MSALPNSRTPSYRKHKATGQAVVTLNGKDVYLGKYGSKESRAEYDRTITTWLANGRRLPNPKDDLDVTEVIHQFWMHAQSYYLRPDGSVSKELGHYKRCLQQLRRLFGTTLANEFGPVELRVLRDHMTTLGWVRKSINTHLCRLKHLFRWAGEHGLVKPTVYHGLMCVTGLRAGRGIAKESERVRPVSSAMVDAVRPFVSRQVNAMIELQLLTGARPGEICIMRGCDLETGGRVWFYRPQSHKTAHLGDCRVIFLGPKAQEVLKPFLKLNTQAFLFSPFDAREDRFRAKRGQRKTKVQPSQANRRKRNPLKIPGDHYTTQSYCRAIKYACGAAFPLPEHLSRQPGENQAAYKARLTDKDKVEISAWRKKHSWHPHQLRHNAATDFRKKYGIEIARILLGHRTAFTTEIYAEVDKQQAIEVMSLIG